MNLQIKEWKCDPVSFAYDKADKEWVFQERDGAPDLLRVRLVAGEDSCWAIRQGGWLVLRNDGTRGFLLPDIIEEILPNIPREYRIKRR